MEDAVTVEFCWSLILPHDSGFSVFFLSEHGAWAAVGR